MGVLKTKRGENINLDKFKKSLVTPKNMSPLNLLIDSDLKIKFKSKTTIESLSMTDIIVDAINEYLKK